MTDASSSARPGDGLRFLLLTGLGTGCSPVAPGTVGTLPAVALGLAFGLALDGIAFVVAVLVFAGLAFAWGAAQTGYLQRRFGTGDPDEMHVDPGAVVLDEVIGYLVALGLFAAVLGEPDADGVVALFAAFRACDILKPPPIRRLEELPGALGVMADDVLAGVYAAPLAGLVTGLLL